MTVHRHTAGLRRRAPALLSVRMCARWFCVDLNQNTEDGIELVYIQSGTFHELADLLGITRHGLRHRAFEVPTREVDPGSARAFTLKALDEDTILELRSRFKYQHRNTKYP